MSAGFPTDNEWADRLEAIGEEGFGEILKAGIRFDSSPGTRYEYSNLGYALLARIIYRITGRNFIQFATEEFLIPLKLTDSTFDYNSISDLASGYVKREEWEFEVFTHSGAFSSIGGLITNLEDLATWSGYLSEAFDPDSPDYGPLLIATRREMQEIHQVIPEMREPDSGLSHTGVNGYGIGLQIEEDYDFGKVAGHSGGYPGYGSHMRWHVASRIGVIALANGRYASPVTACVPALRYLLSKVKEPVVKPSKECLDIQIKVNRLINNWDDQLAEEIFGFNMDLDHPRSYRLKGISDAVEKIGGLTSSMTNLEMRSENASHLAWKLAGNEGSLLIEIWLTPDLSAKLQVLKVLPVDLLNS
jgi:CubicO group peptidase (beta-lactamase class C family)